MNSNEIFPVSSSTHYHGRRSGIVGASSSTSRLRYSHLSLHPSPQNSSDYHVSSQSARHHMPSLPLLSPKSLGHSSRSPNALVSLTRRLSLISSNPAEEDEDDRVSLAVAARLRAAVPEFIYLENQVSVLSQQYMVNKRRHDHILAEVRGTQNELDYLDDQYQREQQILNLLPAILLNKGKRDQHESNMESLQLRRRVAISRLDVLKSQLKNHITTMQEPEKNRIMVEHFSDRLKNLFERTFVGTESDFPYEHQLKHQGQEVYTRIRRLREELSCLEQAKQYFADIKRALQSPYDGTSLSPMPRISHLYQKAKALSSRVPSLDLPENVIKGSKNTLVGEFLAPMGSNEYQAVLYGVRANIHHIEKLAIKDRAQILSLQKQFSSLKRQLLNERTRIFQSAALARDRDYALRTGSEIDASDERSLYDLPPPYSPPGYDCFTGSPMGAHESRDAPQDGHFLGVHASNVSMHSLSDGEIWAPGSRRRFLDSDTGDCSDSDSDSDVEDDIRALRRRQITSRSYQPRPRHGDLPSHVIRRVAGRAVELMSDSDNESEDNRALVELASSFGSRLVFPAVVASSGLPASEAMLNSPRPNQDMPGASVIIHPPTSTEDECDADHSHGNSTTPVMHSPICGHPIPVENDSDDEPLGTRFIAASVQQQQQLLQELSTSLP